jgi:hypothetical protein
MRNRLLVSAAMLVAGVAIASGQHAPGGGQDRGARNPSRHSQSDAAEKAAQPQRGQPTTGSQQSRIGARQSKGAVAGDHGGARDHARNQMLRRPPEHATHRGDERNLKVQPHEIETRPVRTRNVQVPSHKESHKRNPGKHNSPAEDSANKDSGHKNGGQGREPAPGAAAPQNEPATPSTTGAAPASPRPADAEAPATLEGGQQMPDASSRVPAGAPREDYKDEPSGDEQR